MLMIQKKSKEDLINVQILFLSQAHLQLLGVIGSTGNVLWKEAVYGEIF